MSSGQYPQFGGGGSAVINTISTGLTLSSGTLTANLSTGVSGGQSIVGGTASGNSLTLSSTAHATKGSIIFGASSYDEAGNRLLVMGNTTATTGLPSLTTSAMKMDTAAGTSPNIVFAVNGTAVGGMVISTGSFNFHDDTKFIFYASGTTQTNAVGTFGGNGLLLGKAVSVSPGSAALEISTSSTAEAIKLSAAGAQTVYKINAALSLGTSDANIVNIQTNSVTRLAFSGTGGITFPGTATFGAYGATAAAQQASAENLTNNVTSGGTDGTIANYTDLVIYANDAAAIRNDIYQLARKLKQVNDGLRVYGWLT